MINRIVLIEDEKLNADRLKRLIAELRPDSIILAVLESIADSVSWFSAHTADLVMMDVRLADGLSFQIFDKINIACPIIFTTAYDEYAVKAFKYNSVDYLLKPVVPEELKAALDKVDKMHSGKSQQEALEGLIHYFQQKEFRSRFLVPYRDGYKTIFVADILYIAVELKMTKARLQDNSEVVLSQTMEELELQLDPKLFFRVNRQYILQVNAVKQVHHHFNGKLKIELHKNPHAEVLVSREKAPIFKAWMDY